MPTVGDVTESVYASGRIKANNQYNVYSTVSGVLLRANIEAGDTVQRGDTLFVIDNVTSQLNSDNSLALLELSRENSMSGSARFEELELGVQSAEEKYLLDSSLYYRQKNLWEKNIGSRVELEQKQLSFLNSKNQWLSTKAKQDQLKLQLKSELKRAEIGYNISKKSVGDFVIRSNISGVVFNVYKDVNELITPQTPLAVVGDANQFTIELQIDEYDIVKVRPGQEVLITMDSYKGKVYNAAITRIDPMMNERTRTFTAEATFSNIPEVLYPNLTAEANIILQTRKGVISIPRKYLIENKYVYISEDEKVEVTTGLMDYDIVEITSGIQRTQAVYLPPVK